MSKKKKFLSLLMGAISSLSIAGAKGKQYEIKKGNENTSTSYAVKQSKRRAKSQNNTSLEKIFVQRIKDEIFPNVEKLSNLGFRNYDEMITGLLTFKFSTMKRLDSENADADDDDDRLENQNKVSFMEDLKNLKSEDDAKIFAKMFKDTKFKENFVHLTSKGNFNEASRVVINKFKTIYTKQILSDLNKIVNNVVYGNNSRLSRRGCCVSFGDVENCLGKKYFYDLSDLRELSDQQAESVVLRTVLSHLMISDLRKSESKLYSEKSISDLMKQIILSTYIARDDSLDNVSSSLAKNVDSMISRYNKNSKKKYRVNVSWLKKARSSISKDWFGDGYSWATFSKVGYKSKRYSLIGLDSRVFDKKDKLNFIK